MSQPWRSNTATSEHDELDLVITPDDLSVETVPEQQHRAALLWAVLLATVAGWLGYLRRVLDTRHAWWRELAAILGGYWLYELTRGAAEGDRGAAVAKGLAIYHFEQHLHLDPERALNAALAASRALSYVASYYYGILHFIVTVGLLAWLWYKAPREYGYLRTVLVVTSLICLLVFWLVPVAPPRLAVPGMVDVLNRLDVLGARSGRGAVSLANLYAAMPSLHLAWASWAALSVSLTARRRWVRYAVWLYPVLTTLVVLATANHYLMDTVAGTAVMLAVAGLLRMAGLGVHREVELTAEPSAERALEHAPPQRG